MKNLLRVVLPLIVTCCIISINTSCSEDTNCSESGRPMIYCNLYKINPDNQAVLKDTLDSITVRALGTDEIIINNQKKVHSMMLPLRFTKDTTAFILHYDYTRQPNQVDTLYVIHKNSPYFLSMECGYSMKQTIEKVNIGKNESTIRQLESAKIVNNQANTNDIKNLDLFYKYRD